MTPPTNQIHEKLDQWGSRLFNQVIHGKDAVADLKAEWRDGGMPIAPDPTMHDAFHLALGIRRTCKR